MSMSIGDPIRIMLAVLLGCALLIVIILLLAGSGAFGAGPSTYLTSAASVVTTLLPVIGALVACGFILVAFGGRR